MKLFDIFLTESYDDSDDFIVIKTFKNKKGDIEFVYDTEKQAIENFEDCKKRIGSRYEKIQLKIKGKIIESA